jgi:carbonic anhydrase
VCGAFAAGHAQTSPAPDFSYSGDNGPGFWVETSPTCGATGPTARQSPIDIRNAVVDETLKGLALDLKQTSVSLFNNGHTIEAEYEAGTGGTLLLNKVSYNLLQFHFHTLSEHTVEGKRGVMELHAVFKDPNSANIVVIGMLYQIGKENPFLSQLIAAGLPKKTTSSHVEIDALNLATAFTRTSSYYTYPGSLTTPACAQVVTWILLKNEAEMSAEQFGAFRGILGNDFRPLQALNGRVVHVTPVR